MKANELMLGDYVQVNGEVYKVISISYFDIGISDNKKDFYREHIDNIEPIPLTPEILEKNGFVKQWNGSWQFNDYHSIIISDNFYIAIFELSTRLDYVHELQRVLRLCSINKEITL